MHDEAKAFIMRTLERLGPRERVVELGSRNVNGSLRMLFAEAYYLGVDLRPGPGVMVVADAATYRPPALVDTVVCCEVLEHTASAPKIVENAYGMLVPAGVFIATMATEPRAPHSAEDGGPLADGEYYHNVGAMELYDWMFSSGFRRIAIEENRAHGDLYAVGFKGQGNGQDGLHDV